MGKFKYQDQVTTLIKLYDEGKSYAEIARLLNPNLRTRKQIGKEAANIRRLLRNQLGDIHGHPKFVITEEVKQKIHTYVMEGKTPKQISELLNIKYPTVEGYLRSQGFSFLPNQGNVHYFDKIDSYAKAYILGFIAADGALVQSKNTFTTTLTITIKYEDRAVLEFIKSEIGNSHKLLEIRRPSSFDNTKMIHHIRLSMSNPQIVHDIMKYGIVPKKSLIMENIIQNIPFEYRDAFIIGYFDGDGSIHIERNPNDTSLYINIRGTKSFLGGICEHLNITKTHIYQHDSIPNLAFANKKDTYRFYQCYKNLPFYYKRKHDRFLAKINHPSYDKYKQDQTISSPAA